ncbi:putative late blight resistance proteinR1B-17 [Abeliophyllum distichum]|uniref:Late blight resistance proteinR1B-17 n=1 Tax=Abeliophyllum distichum TaxID=126358 RepID=A0ABD1V2P2_9LAMI
MEETKNALTDIQPLIHEVGSFLDFFIFMGNDQVPETGVLDLALSDLLLKFELLKAKINKHCFTVSKMPSDMAPNTAVVLLAKRKTMDQSVQTKEAGIKRERI